MQQRTLGASGLLVSEIGLGGNTFGSTVDGDDAVKVIRRALDSGITFIDTADVYSKGRSEELVGQAITGRRQEVVLATKCGAHMGEAWHERGLSRRRIMQAAEDSLRRLNTDYVDLYQAHMPDPRTPVEETMRAFDDLVRQGKVRYVGGSNYAAWQLAEIRGIGDRTGLAPWVSIQPRWNIVDGLDDPHLLPACRHFGVGIIPYTPLASGILTGKYRRGEEPPRGTRAADLPQVRQRIQDWKLEAVDRLRPWAEERGHTTSELGIAWLLAHEEVSTVIVGARSAEQVDANVRAATWRLSPEERDAAAALVKSGT